MRAQQIVLVTVALLCGIASSRVVSRRMHQPSQEANGTLRQPIASVARQNALDLSRMNEGIQWPPRLGKEYPDLTLRDMNGNPVRLSYYHAGGKVLLIEPIGLSCKACQAFAGGHEVGGLFGHAPQPGLRDIHEYVEHYGRGVRLDDDRIVLVQILFYGPQGEGRCPTLAEAQQWAEHFGRRTPDTVVLLADSSLIDRQTRAMIPGFQLVDADFVLRSDAGNPPRDDLFRVLIPKIHEVLTK